MGDVVGDIKVEDLLQVPKVPLDTAALRVLRWAHDLSLLRPEAYFPGDAYGHPEFDQLTDGAVAFLRQKQIRFVGVNGSKGEISLFLNKAAPGDRMLKSLPAFSDGYRLRFRQGNPDAVSPANVAEAATPCAVHVANGGVRYTCGSSISVGNAQAAGTLGCLVRDATGQLFGLSNNHVSGSCNYSPTGLPIVAPGILDVSPHNPYPFTIGVHARQLTMLMGDPTVVNSQENQDAAVFQITNDQLVSSMQQNFYDTPATALPLSAGMEIEKVGRSSGHTRGRVISQLIGPANVNYAAPQYNFNGVVYFDNMFLVHGIGDRFSEGGDSGSLVVHTDAGGVRHAVGIVVAGGADSSAPGQKLSMIMPIAPILALFGMNLVAGHNV
ncbi:hypothetical protein RI103_14115 [Paraburkholderia sp. FT54]|uniref:hypothetical protein n=1 Tax=Paraburkholderia sp. FT54 TaxID=3074437 RepID=UPI0028772879|nr:hypothetical protein [Paraburkholderia sp. FT54]WNC88834.1 hypothetical protein RI103_14115 [Paraburkholderia sp. FT54]